jgi:hypothetical protein
VNAACDGFCQVIEQLIVLDREAYNNSEIEVMIDIIETVYGDLEAMLGLPHN